jgi:iron complex outermembrane recepter protein
MSAVSANYLRTSSLKPIAHAIAVMLMTAALTPVAAQSTPPAEPKPADTTKQPETKPLEPKSKPVSAAVTGANDPTKLESIVVTAGKRVELLENVPGAISVISSEQLERQNVRSLEDAITLTPAVTVTYGTTAANNGLNMRGIGTSSIGIGVESDVAVIVDDIPLGTQFQAFRDLTDVLRIEVLKGPQSTLVGKNAIAGAISITTKPVTGLLRGEVSTLFTSDREQRFRVTVATLARQLACELLQVPMIFRAMLTT